MKVIPVFCLLYPRAGCAEEEGEFDAEDPETTNPDHIPVVNVCHQRREWEDTAVRWFTRSGEVGLSDGVVLGSQKGITGGGRGGYSIIGEHESNGISRSSGNRSRTISNCPTSSNCNKMIPRQHPPRHQKYNSSPKFHLSMSVIFGYPVIRDTGRQPGCLL
jgi:hypothetical protein